MANPNYQCNHEAHQMHNDALNPTTWQNAIIELKSQLEHARNN